MQRKTSSLLIVGTIAVLAVAVAIVGFTAKNGLGKRMIAATVPATATAPATEPTVAASRPSKKPAGPATRYFDVVRATHPKMATTQPLSSFLDLPDAAHLVFTDPVYLSPRLDLWITRPDAPSVEEALPGLNKDQDGQITPVVRDRVVYVHWQPRDRALWTFEVVCQSEDGRSYDIVTTRGRRKFPWNRNYRWDHAQEWNEEIIVPTDDGISIIRLSSTPTESFHALVKGPPADRGALADVQFLFDWEGILAWIPWEPGKTGSRGLARCVKGAKIVNNEPVLRPEWTDLTPELGWPDKPLQVLPLSDGSVLQLVAGENGAGNVVVQTLEKLEISEDAIGEIVGNLSNEDQEKREVAFKKLSGYGPGIWPILEKMRPDEPPEGQRRIDQLLGSRAAPSLGGRKLLGDKMQIVARHRDGGATVFLENGVSIPGEDPDAPELRVPAWIDLRPGPSIDVIDEALIHELNPAKAKLWSMNSEWIVNSDPRGPRRFVGNGFVPLLRKDEVDRFTDFVGIDRRGRWIFREPAGGKTPASTQATSPATTRSTGTPATLILDPTIPDPTPRLPVWVYTGDEVGWDKDDNPVVRTGETWAALKTAEWFALDKKDKIFTKPEQIPPLKPTTRPATQAATTKHASSRPSTKPVASTAPTSAPASWGKPIGYGDDGTQYFGGLTDLRVSAPNGTRTTWTLPATANGQGEPRLIHTEEGTLFLFNLPGRVLLIRPTPDEDEPFMLEATFTKSIPSNASPARIWLDPAGRIVIASTGQLTILFPKGYIPPAVAKMIPGDQLHLDEQ